MPASCWPAPAGRCCPRLERMGVLRTVDTLPRCESAAAEFPSDIASAPARGDRRRPRRPGCRPVGGRPVLLRPPGRGGRRRRGGPARRLRARHQRRRPCAHADRPDAASWSARNLQIAVRDGGDGRARLAGITDESAESGRGLLLVDALAQAWGNFAAEPPARWSGPPSACAPCPPTRGLRPNRRRKSRLSPIMSAFVFGVAAPTVMKSVPVIRVMAPSSPTAAVSAASRVLSRRGRRSCARCAPTRAGCSPGRGARRPPRRGA